MAEIGVVHLVRARNGIEPFRNFLESYARRGAGIEHDLLMVFKGFGKPADAEPYRDLLKPFACRELFVSDLGFDLRAYAVAARHFNHARFCFLNSFSVILDDDWLKKMSAVAARPRVGLVGATGSYESMLTNLLEKPLPDRGGLGQSARLAMNRIFFQPFPNHHIRTNAFMISRRTMLQIWPRYILTKATAYLFENGKNSLTQRVMRLGLSAVVVGKDGVAYEKEDWHRSNTFRQADQENLLVSDNQTRQYADADNETRRHLSYVAWGKQANPTLR